MVTYDGDRVTTRMSLEVGRPLSGAQLRDSYAEALRQLTFGLVRLRHDSVRAGPIVLLRFGKPALERDSVDWPIEGGLLARVEGGRWRIRSHDGTVEISVEGYRPALPRLLYAASQLQVHQLFTRLYLLRLRGSEPPPGVAAARDERLRAAAVDVAFCLTLARLTGRRRVGHTLVIAMAYHVVCWSLGGRTLGGLVMRQRVVALDGAHPTPAQSVLRLALLPVSWLTRRPLHDEIAGTTVIRD